MVDPAVTLELLLAVINIRSANKLDTPPRLMQMLANSARNGHVMILRSYRSDPIGYVAWLKVNKESLSVLREKRTLPKFPYEWNEGRLMLIYDVVLSKNWSQVAQARLRLFLRGQRFYAFSRRNAVQVRYRRCVAPHRISG